MGWKGNLRTFNATMKKIDREAKKRQRELERQQKEYEKMEALQQARYEVDVYENYIERIQSLHKESKETIDWKEVAIEDSPIEPSQSYIEMNKAKEKFENFKPSLLQKLFGSTEKKKKQLEDNIGKSKTLDEQNYEQQMSEYRADFKKWEEEVELAKKILENDKVYLLKVLKEYGTFSEIEEIGSSLEFSFINDKIYVDVIVHSEEIIPKEKKSLLSSGKLSIKNLPKGQYYEIYQDYVCSSLLRISREVFALLPIEMIVITGKDKLLNKKTGHLELMPIVSIAMSRDTLNSLNLDNIDPSDSMDNFIHNMDFKKTTGFKAVDIVSI